MYFYIGSNLSYMLFIWEKNHYVLGNYPKTFDY